MHGATPVYLLAGKVEKKSEYRIAYGNQSVVRFDDFNFDGIVDLAIQNGREGGYSGPSFDIYLYSMAQKKFIANEKL